MFLCRKPVLSDDHIHWNVSLSHRKLGYHKIICKFLWLDIPWEFQERLQFSLDSLYWHLHVLFGRSPVSIQSSEYRWLFFLWENSNFHLIAFTDIYMFSLGEVLWLFKAQNIDGYFSILKLSLVEDDFHTIIIRKNSVYMKYFHKTFPFQV